jgi:hypothetical protein
VADISQEIRMNLKIHNYDLGDIEVSLIATGLDHPLGERYWMEVIRKTASGRRFIDGASGDYRNARMLSEALRDSVGYGPARDMLRAHGISEFDPLMYLGRNN